MVGEWKKYKYGESRNVSVSLSSAEIPGGVAWHNPFFCDEKTATKWLRLHGLRKLDAGHGRSLAFALAFGTSQFQISAPRTLCLDWGLCDILQALQADFRVVSHTTPRHDSFLDVHTDSLPDHSSFRRYIVRLTLTATLNEPRINKQIKYWQKGRRNQLRETKVVRVWRRGERGGSGEKYGVIAVAIFNVHTLMTSKDAFFWDGTLFRLVNLYQPMV